MTRERREQKRPFKKRKRRPCYFCVEKRVLDYKDVVFLRRFITDRGKIANPRSSGCCAFHQRMVAKVIKKARQMGLAPYLMD